MGSMTLALGPDSRMCRVRHPLGILKTMIDDHFHCKFPEVSDVEIAPVGFRAFSGQAFIFESAFPPVIRSEVAFDELLIPQVRPAW